MRAISLPFRLAYLFDVNGQKVVSYGRIADTGNLQKIWADRVRSVVSTALGERLMRPNFGCPTPIYLFGATDGIDAVLETDVASAFSRWLPDLNFEELIIEQDPESGTLYVDVRYSIPETATSDSVQVAIEVN